MQSMFTPDLGMRRRDTLKALGGLAIGAGISAVGGVAIAASSVQTGDPFADPVDALYGLGKAWSSFDEPAIGAFNGTMWLQVADGALVPVFGMTGIGAMQAKMQDGALFLKQVETCYFTDLATGDILETWHNPFTDETVDVYHFYDDRLQGRIEAAKVPSLIKISDLGDKELMMEWDYGAVHDNPVTEAGWPSYSTGPRYAASEHFTTFGSKAEYFDRSVRCMKTRGAFSRLSQSWPFMKMGKSPLKNATLYGRMFTHKGLKGYDEVPRKVLDYMEKHAPQYLQVPPGWNDDKPTHARLDTWMTFAADIPPETTGYPWTQQPMPPSYAPPTGMAAKYR